MNTPPANSGKRAARQNQQPAALRAGATHSKMNTPPANSGEKGRRGYSDHTTPDKGG